MGTVFGIFFLTVFYSHNLYSITHSIHWCFEWMSTKREIIGRVQFSCPVMSDSLRPHGLQHTMFPCPSPTPGACSNSCPSSRWYHPTISSSVIPFSSCLRSFPASGSFPVSQFFASRGQSIGVSASASVLPMNIQDVLSFKIEFGNMVQWYLRSYFACE